MHNVFRIDQVKLSDDEDQDLKILTERLREETLGSTGPNQLGKLLIHLNKFDNAEEIYQILLLCTIKWDSFPTAYNNIGLVYENMGEHFKAFEFYHKDLEISLETLPSNHSDLQTYQENLAEARRKLLSSSILEIKCFSAHTHIFEKILTSQCIHNQI